MSEEGKKGSTQKMNPGKIHERLIQKFQIISTFEKKLKLRRLLVQNLRKKISEGNTNQSE